ncbi:MAG TPA: AraC family transcriptional regulator [Methylovirgula sp.]|nr:AraC family transcriptional regulator [Methylovirgula sp.]
MRWRVDHRLAMYKTWSPTIAPHDLIIVPPGHEFESVTRGSGQALWLFIDPKTITDDARVRSFAQRTTLDSSWSKDRLLWTIISEIRKECSNGFPRGSVFLEQAAMVFITQLAYFLAGPGPRLEPTRALCDDKLQMVIDYFRSNLDRNITLSEVSGLVELTPRYFCAAFKKAMGRPPHKFQIELRVERAKMLLADPNLTLVDMALMLGFSSQSHLSDCFRRITGVTPARFRAEIRAKASGSEPRAKARPPAWAGILDEVAPGPKASDAIAYRPEAEGPHHV